MPEFKVCAVALDRADITTPDPEGEADDE